MSVRLHVSVHDAHKVFLFRILRGVKKEQLLNITSIYTELIDLGNGKLSSTQIGLNALHHSLEGGGGGRQGEGNLQKQSLAKQKLLKPKGSHEENNKQVFSTIQVLCLNF